MLIWRTILVGLICCTGLAADAQRFEAETDNPEVVSGSRFEVRYILNDAINGQFIPPPRSSFRGVKVILGPSELRSTGFNNGQSYKYQSWTYLLEAGEPGAYALPSASVRVDGEQLTCKPVKIRVVRARAGSKPSPPSSEDEVFIQAELDPDTVFLGQQAIYRIVLYTRRDVSDASLVEAPDFGNNYARELKRFDTRAKRLEWEGKTYVVRTLYEQGVFPQKVGTDTIGPARLQLGIEQPSRFPGLSVPVPVVMQTKPVAMTVLPLPEPQPGIFSGGVGQYFLEASLENESVPANEAALITVSIRGNGDPRKVNTPLLSVPDGLEVLEPSVVEQEDYENGDEWVHTRTLEYVVLAKEPGRYGIMPVLNYFDPDSSKYLMRRLRDSIVLNVGPATNTGGAPLGNSELTEGGGDGSGFAGLLGAWWFWLVLPAIAFAVWYFLTKNKKGSKSSGSVMRTPDSLDAKWRLAHQQVSAAPQTFCNLLLQALQAQLSESLNIPLAELNKRRVREALEHYPQGSAMETDIFHIWEQCELLVYGGMQLSVSQADLWAKASDIRKRLN